MNNNAAHELKASLFQHIAEGWHVFPVNEHKEPLIKGGFHSATRRSRASGRL